MVREMHPLRYFSPHRRDACATKNFSRADEPRIESGESQGLRLHQKVEAQFDAVRCGSHGFDNNSASRPPRP